MEGAGNTPAEGPPRVPEHSRQSLMRCGLQAVNALLQDEFGALFTHSDLSALSRQLAAAAQAGDRPGRRSGLMSFLRPFWPTSDRLHLPLLGDYSVDVLLAALAQRGLDGQWVDVRRPLEPAALADASVIGALVNASGDAFRLAPSWVPLPGSRRHWYALRRMPGVGGDAWWRLDGLETGPVLLGAAAAAAAEVNAAIAQPGMVAAAAAPGSAPPEARGAGGSSAAVASAAVPGAAVWRVGSEWAAPAPADAQRHEGGGCAILIRRRQPA